MRMEAQAAYEGKHRALLQKEHEAVLADKARLEQQLEELAAEQAEAVEAVISAGASETLAGQLQERLDAELALHQRREAELQAALTNKEEALDQVEAQVGS